jgi:hypothetical protein
MLSPAARARASAGGCYPLPDLSPGSTDRQYSLSGRLQLPRVANKPVKPVRYPLTGVQGHANHSGHSQNRSAYRVQSTTFFRRKVIHRISATNDKDVPSRIFRTVSTNGNCWIGLPGSDRRKCHQANEIGDFRHLREALSAIKGPRKRILARVRRPGRSSRLRTPPVQRGRPRPGWPGSSQSTCATG